MISDEESDGIEPMEEGDFFIDDDFDDVQSITSMEELEEELEDDEFHVDYDSSGHSSPATHRIWPTSVSSTGSDEQSDIDIDNILINPIGLFGQRSAETNISQRPSQSQVSQNDTEPPRSTAYHDESSDEDAPLAPYNPYLANLRNLRNPEVIADSNQQSMDHDISQQPSCSKSAQIVKEPQSCSTSANFNESENPDEAFSCSICLDGLTSCGDHRPACLKCGHIFGEHCIIRWIKTGCNSDARRCPTCNTKATLKDIRVLYAKKLVAVDTALLTDLQKKLERELKKNIALTNESHILIEKTKTLSTENEKLKNVISKGNSSTLCAPNSKRTHLTTIKLCKTAGCRVMAYNKLNGMLVVSHSPETTLFNKHIIRTIDTLSMAPFEKSIFVHTKQIRDMAFHPIEDHVLASVSLDKCVNLIDMKSYTVVSSVNVEEPLWSCCWAGDNSNILVAGGQTGSLFYIDKRFMKVLHSEHQRSPACVSLVSIPPLINQIMPKGGFMRARMDLLSLFESSSLAPNHYLEKELSLKGLWSCASYDTDYNHVLMSSKPSGNNKSVRHIVSKMAFTGEDNHSLHPVVTFYGGDKATQLSRSCFVPAREHYDETLAAFFDEKSNTIQLGSLNTNSCVHKFNVPEPVLDLCQIDCLSVNKRRVIAALSAKSISFYCV